MVSSKVLSAISMCLLLTVAACEEKGVPVPPAPDKVTATDSAKAEPKTDPGATEPKTETKDAKTEDPAKDPNEKEEPKTADKPDPKTSKSAGPNEKEPEPTTGDKTTEGSYSAWLQSSGKYKVGQSAAVVAVVSAQGEYKCNDDYPYKFKVGSTPDGVAFASTTVSGASVGKKQTSLRIPFTASSAGSKNISGTFYFSVCNESTCQIKKQVLSVTVNVEE